jgi:hypothetical protein
MGPEAAAIVALLLLAGLLAGFLPVSARALSCGSAFVSEPAAAFQADVHDALQALTTHNTVGSLGGYSAACSHARSSRRVPA